MAQISLVCSVSDLEKFQYQISIFLIIAFLLSLIAFVVGLFHVFIPFFSLFFGVLCVVSLVFFRCVFFSRFCFLVLFERRLGSKLRSVH